MDYESYDSKDKIPDDVGRFQVTWNRENPCEKVVHEKEMENPAPRELLGKNLTGDINYVILDAEGKGHYVGCVLNIDNFDASNQKFILRIRSVLQKPFVLQLTMVMRMIKQTTIQV